MEKSHLLIHFVKLDKMNNERKNVERSIWYHNDIRENLSYFLTKRSKLSGLQLVRKWARLVKGSQIVQQYNAHLFSDMLLKGTSFRLPSAVRKGKEDWVSLRICAVFTQSSRTYPFVFDWMFRAYRYSYVKRSQCLSCLNC